MFKMCCLKTLLGGESVLLLHHGAQFVFKEVNQMDEDERSRSGSWFGMLEEVLGA